jgi:phosphoribosyl-AMP cyclohydrolase / phosphoribosyl-ATP pyrophosphohydrolase
MIPDFNKANGLIPVIIQDSISMQVLMLGYMNEEAYNKTLAEKMVTFYSRSKKRLWKKGETSGNFLHVDKICLDCDNDTLLILATSNGPTCHTGAVSCFNVQSSKGFIYKLESIIHQRINSDATESYTNSLYKQGINKVAQKVGEEVVELIIEAKDNNSNLFISEAADLLYHFIILLKAKDTNFSDIENMLITKAQQAKKH